MNQQAPMPPAAELPKKTFSLRTIIIIASSLILLVIIAIGAVYYANARKERQAEILAANDKIIIEDLFKIRLGALEFYNKNYSYKEWIPDLQLLEAIKTMGSEVVIRKSDYQNYIMYAYLPSEKKYFCIDTYNFADKADQISSNQIDCLNKRK